MDAEVKGSLCENQRYLRMNRLKGALIRRLLDSVTGTLESVGAID
jgi:hypothetical protein